MDDRRELLIGMAAIAIFAVCIYLLANMGKAPVSPADAIPAATPIPPYTEKIEAALAKSDGFEMFVSYTDRGFEPMSTTIKKGDTVRFTNNSSRKLWIAASSEGGVKLYPGTSECGTSAFGTCEPLEPQEFWEFTFTEAGTWKYHNSLNKSDAATVRVQ
jgi:plastocyanin